MLIPYAGFDKSERHPKILVVRTRAEECLWRFDCGFDTAVIAQQMNMREHKAARMIAAEREKRIIHQEEKNLSAAIEYRKLAAESLADWQIGCIPSRPDWSIERELFRSGIAEILSLRLRIAYMPLLQGLQRIEDRVNILATLREDPYAPPPKHRVT